MPMDVWTASRRKPAESQRDTVAIYLNFNVFLSLHELDSWPEPSGHILIRVRMLEIKKKTKQQQRMNTWSKWAWNWLMKTHSKMLAPSSRDNLAFLCFQTQRRPSKGSVLSRSYDLAFHHQTANTGLNVLFALLDNARLPVWRPKERKLWESV